MGALRFLGSVVGGLLSIIGLIMVIYDTYWLVSRGESASALGAGFAVLFIVVGLVLLLVGLFILKKTISR